MELPRRLANDDLAGESHKHLGERPKEKGNCEAWFNLACLVACFAAGIIWREVFELAGRAYVICSIFLGTS